MHPTPTDRQQTYRQTDMDRKRKKERERKREREREKGRERERERPLEKKSARQAVLHSLGTGVFVC